MRRNIETEPGLAKKFSNTRCNRRQFISAALFDIFGLGITVTGFKDLIEVEKDIDNIKQELQTEKQTLSPDEYDALFQKQLDDKHINERTNLGYFRIGGGALFTGAGTLGI